MSGAKFHKVVINTRVWVDTQPWLQYSITAYFIEAYV